MRTLYSLIEVSKLIGVTPETIKNWEQAHYIPQASRMGLKRKRVWSQAKVELILGFARDNGYIVKPLEGVQHG
jgi:DNA-binding transcriptional MerR regulator